MKFFIYCGYLVWVSFSLDVYCSEFPGRECCVYNEFDDEFIILPTSTVSTTALVSTTSTTAVTTVQDENGQDYSNRTIILSCRDAKEFCEHHDTCAAVLAITNKLCGREVVACSTITITKCQAAINTLQTYPFFKPTCLCKEPSVDPECHAFQTFLFDHPCLSAIPESGTDPYLITSLTSCIQAEKYCNTLSACAEIYNNFKIACSVNEVECVSKRLEQCKYAYVKLRMTPLFGCICTPGTTDEFCEGINRRVNHNRCVGKDVMVFSQSPELTNFQSTCHHALEDCLQNRRCSVYIQEVIKYCKRNQCHHRECTIALKNFYRAPFLQKHAVEIAFCICKKTGDFEETMCVDAQNVLHPTCAQDTNTIIPPTCRMVAEECRTQQDCKKYLEQFERHCSTDNDTNQCVGFPSKCRVSMLGILGTKLRVNCVCKTNDQDVDYECNAWQRILWFNPCVVESQRNFHIEKVRKTLQRPHLLHVKNDDNKNRETANIDNYSHQQHTENRPSWTNIKTYPSKDITSTNSFSTVPEIRTNSFSVKTVTSDTDIRRSSYATSIIPAAFLTSENMATYDFTTSGNSRNSSNIINSSTGSSPKSRNHPYRNKYGETAFGGSRRYNHSRHHSRFRFTSTARSIITNSETSTSATLISTPLLFIDSSGSVSNTVASAKKATSNSATVKTSTLPTTAVASGRSSTEAIITSSTGIPRFHYPKKITFWKTSPSPHNKVKRGGCLLQKTVLDGYVFIPEGKGIRLFHENEQECTEICLCNRGELLTCETECIKVHSCYSDIAKYGHGNVAYRGRRAQCICYSGTFLCARPDSGSYSLPPGVFLFIVYSNIDKHLMNKHFTFDIKDTILEMQDYMNSTIPSAKNCKLSLYSVFQNNVIVMAKHLDHKTGSTRTTKGYATDKQIAQDKESCFDSMFALSAIISQQKDDFISNILLSIYKLAEPGIVLPSDEQHAKAVTEEKKQQISDKGGNCPANADYNCLLITGLATFVIIQPNVM